MIYFRLPLNAHEAEGCHALPDAAPAGGNDAIFGLLEALTSSTGATAATLYLGTGEQSTLESSVGTACYGGGQQLRPLLLPVLLCPELAGEDAQASTQQNVGAEGEDGTLCLGLAVATGYGEILGSAFLIGLADDQLLSAPQTALLQTLTTALANLLEYEQVTGNEFADLQARVHRFEALYARTPAMLHSFNGERRMVDVNQAWLDVMGYTRDEIIGQEPSTFMTEASLQYAREVAWPELFRTGYSENVEYQYIKKDGAVIDVLVSAVLDRDSDGNVLRSIAHVEDVTRRKAAERALHSSRDRLQNILQGTNAGTWEWNIKTGELRVNRRWAEIVGYELEELEPISIATWEKLAHPDDLKASEVLLRLHFDGRTDSYQHVLRMRHKRGRWVSVRDYGMVTERDATGAPEWVRGTHIDISQFTELQARMEREQRFLKQTGTIAKVGGWSMAIGGEHITLAEEACRVFEIEVRPVHLLETITARMDASGRDLFRQRIDAQAPSAESWELDLNIEAGAHGPKRVRISCEPEWRDGGVSRLTGAVQDISEQYSAERMVETVLQQRQATLDAIQDGVSFVGADGCVEWMNPAAQRLTQLSKVFAHGRPLSEVLPIVSEASGKPAAPLLERCLSQGRSYSRNGDTLLVVPAGAPVPVYETYSPVLRADGELAGAVVVFGDESETRAAALEMSFRAAHDALTGLANRAEFERCLTQAMEVQRIGAQVLSLLFIDLDNFKLVNDSCGHAAGDRLLVELAQLLRRCTRQEDLVARLGGDEFCVILGNCLKAEALLVAEELCREVAAYQFHEQGQRYRVGASIGLVTHDGLMDQEALSGAGDKACYAAKKAGRNQVVVWRPEVGAEPDHRRTEDWEKRVRHAMQDGSLKLFFQSAVAAAAPQEPAYREALLRLDDLEGGCVVASAFLPALERRGLMAEIDAWVVKQVADTLLEGGSQRRSDGILAVNLSLQSMRDPEFHRKVWDTAVTLGSAASRLCFEIDEAHIAGHTAVREFVSGCSERGIKVALTGFGLSAAALDYLEAAPVDFLKIDPGITDELGSNQLSGNALRWVQETARVIGARTVAERVECASLGRRLREFEVDLLQGDGIHLPAPLDGDA